MSFVDFFLLRWRGADDDDVDSITMMTVKRTKAMKNRDWPYESLDVNARWKMSI